jgi:hypothetical protein
LALELALAADILRTVMIPTWDEIGKLGAIVVLRTILNYFLEREVEQEQKKGQGLSSSTGRETFWPPGLVQPGSPDGISYSQSGKLP